MTGTGSVGSFLTENDFNLKLLTQIIDLTRLEASTELIKVTELVGTGFVELCRTQVR